MNKEKIALLIDSGTDIPEEMLMKDNVFVLPLRIIFGDVEYIDKLNITTQEVFERMKEQMPSTSLPTGEDILNKINEIRERGFKKIIAITISAALSGTNSALRNIVDEYASDLETFVLDTKNISIGAGLFVLSAEKAIVAGKKFSEIIESLQAKLSETKIFFTVGSLEYLKQGGRISSFASLVSDIFNIKPIITCNETGAYTLVAKERGKKKSYDRLIQMVQDVIATSKKKQYQLAIVHGESVEDYESFKQAVMQTLADAVDIVSVSVSPALGVHTGPDAMGIAVQLLDV